MQPQTTAADRGIAVASGYGLKIYVQNGHLVVHDGIGADRNTRRFNRATSKLKRLVVLGHTGYITLDATRWLHDIRAAYVQLDADATLVSLSASRGSDLPALRRAQALAAYNDSGLAVARILLTDKTDGQAALLPELQASDEVHRTMRDACHAVAAAQTIDELIAAEASAASAYWEAWAPVTVPFGPRDAASIPDHWRTFGERHSSITGSPRLAVNAANAILNYLYALLEAETSLACAAIGLDPGLGIFHTDKRARSSLSLDVMEACRPLVDTYLLTLVRHRTLTRKDFAETRRGDCRILPPLAKELASTLPAWRDYIAPVVERVAQAIGDRAPSRLDVPSALTGAKRRAAWQQRGSLKHTNPRLPALPPTCRGCGGALPNSSRTHCDGCRRENAERAGQTARPVAAAALERLRDQGRDPAHGGDAARQRATKNAAHQRMIAEWEPEPGVSYDAADFRRRVLPVLFEMPIAELARATGLSPHYCSLIRLGKRNPHPRHWAMLDCSQRAPSGEQFPRRAR
jgi:CRISPR-associated endonuclease Cas1